MKLEPVFLLPPEPDDRVKLSRRAFVGYSVALLAGGVATGAGLASITGSHAETAANESASNVGSSLPRDLAWARGVATGPLVDLAGNAAPFVAVCSEWPQDTVLSEGITRLVVFVVDDRGAPNRRLAALVLGRHLDRFPSADSAVVERLPALRRLASR